MWSAQSELCLLQKEGKMAEEHHKTIKQLQRTQNERQQFWRLVQPEASLGGGDRIFNLVSP